jgi:hypothetical protein
LSSNHSKMSPLCCLHLPCCTFYRWVFELLTNICLVPMFIFSTVRLMIYLGIGCSANGEEVTNKKKKRNRFIAFIAEYNEGLMFLLLGFGIVISQEAADGIDMSDEFNFMHVMFGVFVLGVSIFGFLLKTKFFSDKSVNFTVPLILIYIGILFLIHKQFNEYGYYTHRAFGLACVTTGVLKAVTDVYPKAMILLVLSAHFAAALFASASHHFVELAQLKRLSPSNYIFIVANVVLLYVGVVCVIGWLWNKYCCGSKSNYKHIISSLELRDVHLE